MTNVVKNIRHFSFFVLLFLVLGSSDASAQMFDSIAAAFKHRPGLTGGFATKTTFINGFRSPIFTARSAFDYNHCVRVGGGISWLKLSAYDMGTDNTPFYLDKPILYGSETYMAHPSLKFWYVSAFFEYVYFNSKKWQFSIPLQLGIGDTKYKYNFNGVNYTEKQHWVLLYEPAVCGQYKITQWFGVGLDVGLRVMLVTNKSIGTKFNSPMYDVKALMYWGELYRMVREKHGKRK